MGISYNIGASLTGGAAPVIITTLGFLTSSKIIPAIYLTAFAMGALFILWQFAVFHKNVSTRENYAQSI